ncbi:hypothetical protein [Azospirillum sp.]|uniref:hypothetical protein n=1 Tax=Azospirillum sp. TaxID=34012 RepID=UPI003D73F2A0
MAKSKTYQVLGHSISGIKCDAVGCGYRDDTARLEDYPKLLNAPCPKCGAPLLTEADFNAVLKHMAGVVRINVWANRWLPEWLLRRMDVNRPGAKLGTVRVEMNGTGKAKFAPVVPRPPVEPEEGGPCPDGCGGTLELPPPENCSCHIAPPCGDCTDRVLTCSRCGWEAA